MRTTTKRRFDDDDEQDPHGKKSKDDLQGDDERIGYWPVLITLRIKFTNRILDALNDIKSSLKEFVTDWTEVKEEDYHITLNRPLSIQQSHFSIIKERIESICSKVKPFEVSFSGINLLKNDDSFKQFLCLMCSKGKSRICKIIKDIDILLQEQELPTFYESPLPHISLFISSAFDKEDFNFWDKLDDTDKDYVSQSICTVVGLDCRIGIKTHSFDFDSEHQSL
jgi:2'-5' RNA ligase